MEARVVTVSGNAIQLQLYVASLSLPSSWYWYIFVGRTDGKVFETKLVSFLPDNNATTVQLKPNDIVTFSFTSRFNSSSIPIGPTFTAVRTDLDWSDLVSNQRSTAPRKQSANGISPPDRPPPVMLMYYTAFTERALQSKTAPAPKPSGYWTRDEGVNVREFFISFARARGMDPFLPETWYSVTTDLVASSEVCSVGSFSSRWLGFSPCLLR